MSYHAHDAYLESRILSADPVELTRALFHACTSAVRDARRHLESGEIRERSNAVSKACEILFELNHSLDHTRGGEISQRLALLYDYMQRQLIEAHSRQADAPLAEVLALLATLSEAWDAIGVPAASSPSAPAQSPWVCEPVQNQWAGAMGEPEPAGCSAGGWSF